MVSAHINLPCVPKLLASWAPTQSKLCVLSAEFVCSSLVSGTTRSLPHRQSPP